MKKQLFTFAIVMNLILVSPPAVVADDEAPELSFSSPDPYQTVSRSLEQLTSWARGEYAEHKGEGLFARHPEDGAVISTMLILVDELKQLAKEARVKGDEIKARAYLFSAEATVRYAAQMPHSLEERVAREKDK